MSLGHLIVPESKEAISHGVIMSIGMGATLKGSLWLKMGQFKHQNE